MLKRRSIGRLHKSSVRSIVFTNARGQGPLDCTCMTVALSGSSRGLTVSCRRIAITEHLCHSKRDRCLVGNDPYQLGRISRLFCSANVKGRKCSVVKRKRVSQVLDNGPRRQHRLFSRTTKVMGFGGQGTATRGGLRGRESGLIHMGSVLSRLRHRIRPLRLRSRGTGACLGGGGRLGSCSIGVFLVRAREVTSRRHRMRRGFGVTSRRLGRDASTERGVHRRCSHLNRDVARVSRGVGTVQRGVDGASIVGRGLRDRVRVLTRRVRATRVASRRLRDHLSTVTQRRGRGRRTGTSCRGRGRSNSRRLTRMQGQRRRTTRALTRVRGRVTSYGRKVRRKRGRLFTLLGHETSVRTGRRHSSAVIRRVGVQGTRLKGHLLSEGARRASLSSILTSYGGSLRRIDTRVQGLSRRRGRLDTGRGR